MSKSKRLLCTPSVAKSVTNCLPIFSGCFELGLSSNLWEKYQNLSAWCSTIVIDACETPKTGIFLWRKWARGGGGASRELFNESPWESKNSNISQFPVAFAPSGALCDMMRHYRSTNHPTFESSLIPTPQELVPLVASSVSVHLVSQELHLVANTVSMHTAQVTHAKDR